MVTIKNLAKKFRKSSVGLEKEEIIIEQIKKKRRIVRIKKTNKVDEESKSNSPPYQRDINTPENLTNADLLR